MRDTQNCIQTYTGRIMNPFKPRQRDVCIEDIAHALANQARFTGHSRVFYSVAEHSLHVSRQMPTRKLKLAALMHDASEAYLADIATPLKRHPSFAYYKVIEDGLMECIFKALKIPHTWHTPKIKEADRRMCATEAYDLMAPFHPQLQERWEELGRPYRTPKYVFGYGSEEAEMLFLREYKRLTNEETKDPDLVAHAGRMRLRTGLRWTPHG